MLHTCLPTHRSLVVARAGHAPSTRPRTSATRNPALRPSTASTSAKPFRVTQRIVTARARTPEFKEDPAQVEEVTGVVFEPFDEVQLELANVDKTDNTFESFARSNFHPQCEAALNEQINVEYNVSVVYHALYAYFDRDNVALSGIAEFFRHQSLEEREHAEKCMKYQNERGGRVKLKPISAPLSEFYHKEKGDALYAMELALSLEKLNFQKLRDMWKVADSHDDPAFCDFIEGDLLKEQVESIKQVSEYVSNLRRVGLGHGVFHFDRVFRNGHAD